MRILYVSWKWSRNGALQTIILRKDELPSAFNKPTDRFLSFDRDGDVDIGEKVPNLLELRVTCSEREQGPAERHIYSSQVPVNPNCVNSPGLKQSSDQFSRAMQTDIHGPSRKSPTGNQPASVLYSC